MKRTSMHQEGITDDPESADSFGNCANSATGDPNSMRATISARAKRPDATDDAEVE